MTLDATVVIGRFEPPDDTRLATIVRALAASPMVIVIVTAARKPRSIAHPWTARERIEMITQAVAPADRDRLRFGQVADAFYNEAQWVKSVQDEVARFVAPPARLGIVGNSAAAALFPQWQPVEILSRTPRVLDTWFASGDAGAVPAVVGAWLERFRSSEAFAQLARQYAYIRDYKAAWKSAPYPPVYVTVDAAVIHSGHLLLIRRANEPGKGLWALPGGFLDQDERIFDACIRELREETRVALAPEVLRGALRETRVFDHPRRSLRGRTITHGFCFVFPGGPLPAVAADDDADHARWVPLAEFAAMPEQMFDDHYDIGMYFLGRI